MTLRSRANSRDDGWRLGKPADLPDLPELAPVLARLGPCLCVAAGER